jgi:hypothetical protein
MMAKIGEIIMNGRTNTGLKIERIFIEPLK